MEEKNYLKWYNKVGYGSGDIAGNVVFAFLSSFIMIYLTNTVGLNAGVIGSLIAFSKILDGVSDVFFGSMIDKTHSKMGKARPWMLWAYIGCAITLVAAFAVPFKEAYFLEDALKFREALPGAPLIYVGGLVSREKIDEVLDAGFDAVQMARALLNEPGFVNRMAREDRARCNCGHSNYCIGRMYTIEMACHKHLNEELPPCLQKEIEKLEKK